MLSSGFSLGSWWDLGAGKCRRCVAAVPCYARCHGVILGKSLHFWASSCPTICQEGQGAAS